MKFFEKLKKNIGFSTDKKTIENNDKEDFNTDNESLINDDKNATLDTSFIDNSIEQNNVSVQNENFENKIVVETNLIDDISIPAINFIEKKTDNVVPTPEVKTKTSIFSKVTKAVKSSLNIEKIKIGLSKTKKSFSDELKKILVFGRTIDENLLSEIEEILIKADIGVDTTEQIINALRRRIKIEKKENSEDLYLLLKEEIKKLLTTDKSLFIDNPYHIPEDNKPYIIMLIGVNGVGKTTTVGKLAYNYKNAGNNVIIGAADTFRAAANEQLDI